jgi:hypothetical protein
MESGSVCVDGTGKVGRVPIRVECLPGAVIYDLAAEEVGLGVTLFSAFCGLFRIQTTMV